MNRAVQRGAAKGCRNRLRLLWAGFLLAAVGSCSGWLWWASHRGLTAEALERSIRAEVPPGCDRRVVAAWFDRHNFRHAWSEDTRVAGQGHQTVAELAGLWDEDLGGVSFAGVEGPEVNVDLFFPGRIDIYFFFDRSGRCVGHYVAPFAYEL